MPRAQSRSNSQEPARSSSVSSLDKLRSGEAQLSHGPVRQSEPSPTEKRDEIPPMSQGTASKQSKARFTVIYSECELLLALTFSGIAGTMGRNGLEQLLQFENLGSVWPNFAGCFVIAFVPALTTSVLNTVIGVGFCGAMTSFSELITDIMMQATTPQPNWPDYGYGVPLFMARFLLEISCCFVGFTAGKQFADFWTSYGPSRLSEKHEIWVRRVAAMFGLAAWVVCIVTAITSPNRSRWWPLSGLFAPFGVWLRYYLSKLNNPSNTAFKWGTFIANTLATAIACVLQLCNLLPSPSPLQRQFLTGLQKGFCGCLSTISTFVRELNTMRVAHAYYYGLTSLFVGYSLAFIIIGSYKWTR